MTTLWLSKYTAQPKAPHVLTHRGSEAPVVPKAAVLTESRWVCDCEILSDFLRGGSPL